MSASDVPALGRPHESGQRESGQHEQSEGEPTPERREPPDLRLAPLVGAVWLGQALVLLVMPSRPTTPALLAAGALLLVLVVAAGWLRLQRGARAKVPSRRVVVGFLLLSGLALGTFVGSMHLARLHPPVVVAAAQGGAVVQVEATLTSDPVVRIPEPLGGRPMPPRWSVGARVSAMEFRGRRYSVRAPVLLRGDQVQSLRYGSQVALTGRAQESWSPEVQSFNLAVLGEVHVRSPPGPAARITTRVREAFRDACAGLPRDAAALLLGLAVGDESLVSPELDAAMIRAGLAHLTAVSGSNTSLVVAIAMSAVVGLGLGWRVRVGVCLAVLWGYVLLVRPEPSVLRAAVMGVVALIALSTGGRRRGPPALLASGLVLLVVLPQFALSMGFALSFAATAGLLVVGPPIAEQLGRYSLTARVPEPIRAALAVAAAAHLATLPLVILMGNGASLVALPANVLVTPLVPGGHRARVGRSTDRSPRPRGGGPPGERGVPSHVADRPGRAYLLRAALRRDRRRPRARWCSGCGSDTRPRGRRPRAWVAPAAPSPRGPGGGSGHGHRCGPAASEVLGLAAPRVGGPGLRRGSG